MDNDKLTLSFEDGEELEVEIMGVFDVKGREYIALLQKEADEVYLYRYLGGENDFELGEIESDEELEEATEAFHAIMDEIDQ
ncbi:MAG: DUF1292 domain-containing protein [Oscillospiraceae bacterium]|nr:DUF1292 domain-containing protein [Oscillospiraceae bacterium]